MDDEIRNLKGAFERKERSQSGLSDLEGLKERGLVDPEQYRTMKADYQQNLTTAVSEIASIKSQLKLQLQATDQNLGRLRAELEDLSVRHKVGELNLEQYHSRQQRLIDMIRDAEDTIGKLQKLLAAKSADHIYVKHTEVRQGGIPLSLIHI